MIPSAKMMDVTAETLQSCEQLRPLHPVEGLLGIKGYDYFWVRRGRWGVDDAEKPSNVGEWVPLSDESRLIFWHDRGHTKLFIDQVGLMLLSPAPHSHCGLSSLLSSL